MWCGLYGFLIIKLQTTLYYAVRYTVTCNAMQLYHFTDNFGMVLAAS